MIDDAELKTNLQRRALQRDGSIVRRERRHWSAVLVPPALATPLFLTLEGGRISGPRGPEIEVRGASIALPISLIVIIVALAATASRLRAIPQRSLPTIALVAFASVNLIAFTYGSLARGYSGVSAAFLLQTLIPLLGYVYGTQLFTAPTGSLEQTYRRMLSVPLFSLLAIAATTLLDGGRPWIVLGERLGPLDIPQIRRYVPTVWAMAAVGYGFQVASPSRTAVRRLCLLLLSIILLSAAHSRTSLLILGAAAALSIIGNPLYSKPARLVWLAWSLLALVIVIAVVPSLVAAPTGLNRLLGDDATASISTERRYEALVSSFSETLSSPLGRAYATTEDRTLAGIETIISRVSYAENQFGEYGLRAGPLAVVAIAVFLVVLLRDARRAIINAPATETTRFFAAIWVAVTATLLVALFTQQPLSQPYSGLYLFTALGLLRGWTLMQLARPRGSVHR